MSKGSQKRWKDRRKAMHERLEIDSFDARDDVAAIRRFERERLSGRSRASLVHGGARPHYDVSPVAM